MINEIDDVFDKKLDLIQKWSQGAPKYTLDAAVYVRDTLDLCWAAARSVFKDDAKPNMAFEIYDRIEAKKKQIEEADI